MFAWIVVASCLQLYSASRAEQLTARIVGLGATSCSQFMADVAQNPLVQRTYFAWAQGFMSGILIGRPAGVDESLDLAPSTFPLLKQLEFLRNYCQQHPAEDFSDAVEILYKTLRKERAT